MIDYPRQTLMNTGGRKIGNMMFDGLKDRKGGGL